MPDPVGPPASGAAELSAVPIRSDGSIDRLPATWLQSVLWAQLHAGWSYLAEHDGSRHEVLGLVTRTFASAVTPEPDRANHTYPARCRADCTDGSPEPTGGQRQRQRQRDVRE
ncbi:hypothetical protein [Micromonospora sp. C95]|uniref:hypothetical protein n=1 Tax=Micromonospora sp. C95 TaxID=2824882 RepID=UPI001B386283|nr:hypothetical protein [Micromonospora sp. C95]MBQ1028088.1 hypothetical protein [Micromonospora sp. C95]